MTATVATVSVVVVRWEDLFADLEGQAEALERQEMDAELVERTRAELSQVTLLSRLRAQLAQEVVLTVRGVGPLSGRLTQVGADWLLLSTPEEVVVPVAAIAAVTALPPDSVSSEGVSHIAGRIRMTTALRAIAIDRDAVTVLMRDGQALTGTPDRVGADFVDLAVHELDEAPRRATVRKRVTVSLEAISAVRRSRRRRA
jgi:hypothetical protein